MDPRPIAIAIIMVTVLRSIWFVVELVANALNDRARRKADEARDLAIDKMIHGLVERADGNRIIAVGRVEFVTAHCTRAYGGYATVADVLERAGLRLVLSRAA